VFKAQYRFYILDNGFISTLEGRLKPVPLMAGDSMFPLEPKLACIKACLVFAVGLDKFSGFVSKLRYLNLFCVRFS
jgi:hypothetical protein